MTRKTITIKDIEKRYDNYIAELVQTACNYEKCEVVLEKDNHRINAKSFLGVMALCPADGMELTLETDGKNEENALNGMEQFLTCCQ